MSVINLHFSMQEEDIIEYTNAKWYLCKHLVNS